MLSKDGRQAIPLTLINNQEFVAVDDLAATFQLAVHEDALGALTITYKGKTIVLTNQALASVAGRLVSLPAPAARAGRRWRSCTTPDSSSGSRPAFSSSATSACRA
jgi:hypothetical protein